MAAMVQAKLFSWDAIEARSELDQLQLVIDRRPDERLVQYLEVMRGVPRPSPMPPRRRVDPGGVRTRRAHLRAHAARQPELAARLQPPQRLERINSALDRHFGFEQHFIRGIAKMTTRVGLAIVVMMALALGNSQQGRPAQMRSLVQPIPATS